MRGERRGEEVRKEKSGKRGGEGRGEERRKVCSSIEERRVGVSVV